MGGLQHFWEQGDLITRGVAVLLLLMSVSAWVLIVWKGWLLRRVRSMSPDTDVVIMTAFSSVPSVVTAFKLGADDYITKPFTEEELLSRIGAIEARRKHSPRVIR